jgi:hypothetical protein
MLSAIGHVTYNYVGILSERTFVLWPGNFYAPTGCLGARESGSRFAGGGDHAMRPHDCGTRLLDQTILPSGVRYARDQPFAIFADKIEQIRSAVVDLAIH